jgi:hypothetical protein
MSTTPPPPPPEQQHRGYGYSQGGPMTGITLPRFNSELVLYLLVEILFFILWLSSKFVNADLFMTTTAAVTVGYLISRGIAKASRVIEQ